ncbi:hypothetical protein VCRA2110O179_460017 [Vibrio crassostreae]|nr:hypothetical protein VCRA2110O179_460017 [Vibrio crassostreae]
MSPAINRGIVTNLYLYIIYLEDTYLIISRQQNLNIDLSRF